MLNLPATLKKGSWKLLDAGLYRFDQSLMLLPTVIEEGDESQILIEEWDTRHKEYKHSQITLLHQAHYWRPNRSGWILPMKLGSILSIERDYPK